MRNGARKPAALALMAIASACSTTAPTEHAYVAAIVAADRESRTFAPASEVISSLDLTAAYRIQRELVRRRLASGDRIAGFKSGLMSAMSLADRNATEPLVGVLFASGDYRGGSMVDICEYRRPAFEMKLGFTFESSVRGRLGSIDELKQHIANVQPVIELPDIAYANDKTYQALDMVAANISSAKFVRGVSRKVGDLDLDAIQASIEHDGRELTRGVGKQSLDGQWSSLLVVVNLIVANGRHIRPGQVVLTGKIGDKKDLHPGAYRANYGPLGTTDFQIAHCDSM